MLEHVESLECLGCQRTFRPSLRACCPDCADGGQLRFRYAMGRLQGLDRAQWVRREPWVWRYRELLPFDALVEPPPLQVGHTPLYGSARLATFAGVRGLYVKDESRHPTGCTADRAAAVLVAGGAEASRLAAAGLAGPVAALAASAGLRLVALLRADEDATWVRALGARTVAADPSVSRREALLLLRAEGLYLADRPNPLAFEGLKTLGLELGEQLAERLPDWIAVDAEEPELVEAVIAGLDALVALDFYRERPRVLAVDGAGGGDAAVATSEIERIEAAEAGTRALGLSLAEGGVAALAGVRRAVAEGQLAADSTVAVVVQGERGRSERRTFPEGEVMRSCQALVSAALR